MANGLKHGMLIGSLLLLGCIEYEENTMIHDTFTYTQDELLSDQSNWVQGLGDLVCNGAAVYCSSSWAMAYRDDVSGEDQWARCEYDTNESQFTGYAGPAVRCSGGNGYAFISSWSLCVLVRFDDGVPQILEQYDYIQPIFSGVLEIHAISDTITCYMNGHALIEYTDDTYTEGGVGVAGRFDDTVVADELWGGVFLDLFSTTQALTNITRKSGGVQVTRGNTWTASVARGNTWQFNVTKS